MPLKHQCCSSNMGQVCNLPLTVSAWWALITPWSRIALDTLRALIALGTYDGLTWWTVVADGTYRALYTLRALIALGPHNG
jgi:hypothetical protein